MPGRPSRNSREGITAMVAPKHSLLWPAVALFALAPGWLLLGHLVIHAQESAKAPSHPTAVSLAYPGEKHLAHVRQLTFGGQSAEAYFSADDKYLTFQHQGQFFDPRTHASVEHNVGCDQIFRIPVDSPAGQPVVPKLISNGQGRTTCSYFFPSGDRI